MKTMVDTDEGALWFVICSSYDVFRRWARRNKLDPADPRFRVFYGQRGAGNGRYSQQGDRIWILYRKRIRWDYKGFLLGLLPAGYTVYTDERGELRSVRTLL